MPPSIDRSRRSVRSGRAVRVAVAVAVLLATVASAAGVAGVAGAAAPTGSPGAIESEPPTDETTASSGAANRTADPSDPRILELYPNPTTEGNRGEYLVVRLPEPGNWSLSDGYHDAMLPPDANGTVALSMEPKLARDHLAAGRGEETPPGARQLDAYFPLSASGDRIELRRDGDAVDVVEYGRVREGYRWRATWGEWRPIGYEPREPERVSGASVTPFVLPDTPATPVEPLATADDRIYLAGYTIESERVADRLVDAAARGADVRVLLEGTPVGGFPRRGARVADRLVDAGVEVRVLDGDPDRFRFHHAKYAVADDRAVVLTENWKRSGTGGESNRGWGVIADDPAVAEDLAALFENDATGPDTRSWRAFREETTFHGPPRYGDDDGDGEGSGDEDRLYPTRFDPPTPAPADVELLTAPGNAGDRLVERIDAADDRVLAIVPRTGGPDGRIVRALRRAADRGVDVHLLLSNAWYDREENRELAEALSDEPIEVAVAEPRGRYEKVHAKGLVVDDTAVVGSLNWNEGATTENREVLLAVENAGVADFYARTYAADWRGGGVHLPVGTVGGLLGTVVVAGAVARREVAFA
ncbi:Phosphatidylserine/phosphatidylglycerophosphate/cardiolipin synthase [Halorubrum aquaticum]|uniref:Phosphatidylserine/phosphatidylglycerophosphate/cardiolipin synthase n=1 Tax=Halorubrum aquaticum TaxID=387340 RepID=A0A1I3C9K5_9EURY|nr:phospholipase D-like domain-containing protein [Halorubrum aquaticum]SFH71006.1 Phosphatidylserine/phosphatidylglycerophosphate/cardiolipin synthase [Halorubrum aquaticum]